MSFEVGVQFLDPRGYCNRFLAKRMKKPHGREFRFRGVQVAGTGFELPRENPVKTAIPNHGGAECGALSAQHLKLDPQLQTLILAWPDLPATLKAGILAMVESCTDR